MINLIPTEEKKKKTQIFYLKFLVVIFIAFGFLAIVLSVSVLPSYIVSSSQKKIVDTKLKEQQKEPMPEFDQKNMLIIQDINSKLSLVENTEKNKFLISQKIIAEIISKKILNIKITKIFYQNDLVGGKKVEVQGIASSREQLLLFRQALENDPVFSVVDLPISNFVKESNILFSLTLIPL